MQPALGKQMHDMWSNPIEQVHRKFSVEGIEVYLKLYSDPLVLGSILSTPHKLGTVVHASILTPGGISGTIRSPRSRS